MSCRCGSSNPTSTSPACPTARRWRSRTWRCSCSASCSSTSWLGAARASDHPGRHLRRHRLVGRVRHARQARRRCLHADATGSMSPFQAAQMYTLHEPNIFNLAVRGRVRRLPGHRQGGQRRRRLQARATASARSTRSTGPASWPRWSYYVYAAVRVGARRAGRVELRRPAGQFRQRLRRIRRAPDGAADPSPDRRHQRERRARRVLPHRAATACAAPRGRRRPPARRWTSPRRRTSSASSTTCSATIPTQTRALFADLGDGGGFDLAGTAALRCGRRHRLRLRLLQPRRPHRNDSPGCANEFDIVVDPHTADGLKVGLEHAEPGVPLVCLETAQPVKFAATIEEALGDAPELPPHLRDLGDLPQRYEVIDADVDAVKAYIAANATTATPAVDSPPCPTPRPHRLVDHARLLEEPGRLRQGHARCWTKPATPGRTTPEAADVVMVNTCAFIEAAREESIETILELREAKRDGCPARRAGLYGAAIRDGARRSAARGRRRDRSRSLRRAGRSPRHDDRVAAAADPTGSHLTHGHLVSGQATHSFHAVCLRQGRRRV